MELVREHLTRQSDLIPHEVLSLPVKMIGAGAIGSFATLQLVKMGFTDVEVFDFDMVSIENMSCQFYRLKDIGQHKVFSLANIVEDFTGERIIPVATRFVPRADLRGVVVVAVDSMAVRSEIFDQIREQCYQVKYIIDPRMGAEDAALYVMNPFDDKDVKSYAKTLYTDAAAVQERCTAKATIYTANLLSGLVAKAVKNIACSEPYPRVTQWSIKNNQLQSWSKGGANEKEAYV